ncbi:MAG: S8 family peptidase [Muribaculaceae bacterium]
MKKLYLLAALALIGASPAWAQSKFDLGGRSVISQYRIYQQDPANALPVIDSPVDFEMASRAGARVAVYVTLNAGATAADLEARGFEILVDLDDIVLANGTMDDIIALEECDFVKALSFGEKRGVLLDQVRIATGVDEIHEGSGIPSTYKGAGVVAGIFDTGCDPNHINFTDANGDTRVGSLWHFNSYDGSYNFYGTPESIATFKTDDTSMEHGTHTTGIMAGSYNKRGGQVAILGTSGSATVGARFTNPYYGMAPEATIAMACGDLYDPNITTSVSKIIEYAEAQGMPVVVNLSIGSVVGPHDGSDALSQTLNRLGERGIICIASGNDGDAQRSLAKTFTAAETSIATLFVGEDGVATCSGTIEIYSDSSTPFTLTPVVYDRVTGKEIFTYDIAGGSEQTVVISTSNYSNSSYIHDTAFDRAFSSSSVRITTSLNAGTNKRYSVRMEPSLTNSKVNNGSNNYVFGFKISGSTDQLIHVTAKSENGHFDSLGAAGYTDGTGDFSINAMACFDNCIVVGSWNSRLTVPCIYTGSGGVLDYTDVDGYHVGDVSPFSSYGTLINGRKLPDICAPGCFVISSINKYYYDALLKKDATAAYYLSVNQTAGGRENHWQYSQGTSMACPVVSGIVALLLQYDPTLTVDDIRDLIVRNATVDDFVTTAQWGAGKINAIDCMMDLASQGVNDVVVGRESGILATAIGENLYDITVPGARNVNVAVYSTTGQLVATAAAEGQSVELSTAALAKGVYVLNANGAYSTKIVVR